MADLLLPFQFPFMQQAFLIAGLVALPMALLSCFLVLRGWSLMGDAISHAVLPGVVLAHAAGLPILVGAFVAGLLCATATGWLRDNSRIKEDTVSWGDIGQAAAIAAVIVAALVLKRADFTAVTFDPLHARAIGLKVRLLDHALLAMIALAVVGALQAVGIILAIALMITPGATAALWTRRMGPMLLFAAVFGVVTAQAGVYAAFWIDAAPAPTIVLIQTLGFLLSLARVRRGVGGGIAVR